MDDESSVIAARIYALAQQPRREFAAVEARAVPGYDRRWYDRVARELGPLGFASVGDYEALHRARGQQVILRLLISRYGTIVASATSVSSHPGGETTGGWRRWFGSRQRERMLEFETEFADDSLLLTDNADGLEALEPPPAIERHAMPRSTPLRELFEVHAARIKEILHTRAAVPRRLVTVDEWLASQERQHDLISAYRRRIGWVTDDELKLLTGERYDELKDRVRAELHRLGGS